MTKSMTFTATVASILLIGSSAFAAPCLLDQSSTLEQAQAEEAAQIVCMDLRAQGVDASHRTVDGDVSGEAYVVRVARLDKTVLVSLTHQNDAGKIVAHEQTSLASLDEIVSVSPRLAEAVATGTSFAHTAGKRSLTAQETQETKSQKGLFLLGVGIAGAAVPGTAAVAPGLQFHMQYDLDRIALHTNFYFNSVSEGDDVSVGGTSLGGKYYFSDGNFSPYVGTGLAWSRIDFARDNRNYHGSGLELYLEGGVEFARFSQARMVGFGRVGAPLYTARDRSEYYDDMGRAKASDSNEYGVPVTLGLSVLF